MPSVTPSNRILLRPANTSRISFWWQVGLGLLTLAYVLFARWADVGEHPFHFVHWVFLALSLSFLGYVLIDNSPLLGTQSYLEFTPGYIVHKNGLFRPKQVFAAENITRLELVPRQVRVHTSNDGTYTLSLREVRGRKRRRLLMEQLRTFAIQHRILLSEGPTAA